MVSYKVYKPAADTSKIDFGAPKEIDKPEYDDRGVSFKGYSKTPSGNKEYILNPQEPFIVSEETIKVAGNPYLIMPLPDNTKDAYITKICFSITRLAATAGVSSVVYFVDGNGKAILKVQEPQTAVGTMSFDFNFQIPLKIQKGNTPFFSIPWIGTGNYFSGNIYGWQE